MESVLNFANSFQASGPGGQTHTHKSDGERRVEWIFELATENSAAHSLLDLLLLYLLLWLVALAAYPCYSRVRFLGCVQAY